VSALPKKKVFLVLLPFLLIFLFGFSLLLRPQFPVQITEVVDTFARQEKTSPRSTHRHTVYYATVTVALDDVQHQVIVRDNTWMPLKAGDSIVVTKDLFGRVVEYSTRKAYILMLFSAFMGPMCFLLAVSIAKRQHAKEHLSPQNQK